MSSLQTTDPEKINSKLSFEVSQTAPADWEEFVSRTTKCVFHGSLWEKTLKEGYHVQPLYFTARENGVLRTGLSGSVFSFLFFKVFFSTVPYGGFLGDTTQLPAFTAFIEEQLGKQGVHQIRITQVAKYSFPALEGYREKRAFQHALDLQGKTVESLWEGYRKNNRRDVSKALRSGIRIVEGKSSEDLKAYYGLYDETMRRNHSLRFYPKPFYESIWKYWVAEGKAAILLAEYQGKKIAGNLLIFSEDTTYLFGSVSSDEFLKLCPNDALIHEAISQTITSGRRTFDFMMSDLQDAALIRFKEKWGAQSFPFSILEKDLAKFQTSLWKILWKISTSKWGSWLLAQVENIKTRFRS